MEVNFQPKNSSLLSRKTFVLFKVRTSVRYSKNLQEIKMHCR